MVTNKSGGTRRSSGSGKSNESNRGGGRDKSVVTAARDNTLVTAAAVGGAVAAGAFLWSRRGQISEQIGRLGRRNSGTDGDLPASSASGDDGRSQREIAEEALTLKEMGSAS